MWKLQCKLIWACYILVLYQHILPPVISYSASTYTGTFQANQCVTQTIGEAGTKVSWFTGSAMRKHPWLGVVKQRPGRFGSVYLDREDRWEKYLGCCCLMPKCQIVHSTLHSELNIFVSSNSTIHKASCHPQKLRIESFFCSPKGLLSHAAASNIQTGLEGSQPQLSWLGLISWNARKWTDVRRIKLK